MPSRKIYGILIICASLVLSAWIINKKPSSASATNGKIAPVKTFSVENKSGDDWKKTIASFNTPPQAYTDLTKNNTSVPDETTLTGQISVDFMSKYILAKQDGQVTEAEMKEITDSIVNSKAYLSPQTSIYTPSNLSIVGKDDTATLQAYRSELNLVIKEGFEKIKVDPLFILYTAMKNNNEADLAKLDPIITANRIAISSFLKMPVPKKMVSMHLDLLNILANTLQDFEAMKNMFNDPVRGLQGASNYNTNVKEFVAALNKMNTYLDGRLGN